MRGRFITLEGGEGVGKSTQLHELAAALRERGLDVVETREPGGSPGAELIRDLLLAKDAAWDAPAEALLFAAARADHVAKTIEPALAEGRWVLCDRFLDSSLAYQGGAGRLGVDAVRGINVLAIGDTQPDRTLLLMLTDGIARASERDEGNSDAIGGRSTDYHLAVNIAFLEIFVADTDRVHIVDATGGRGEVTQRLLDELADLLP